MAYSTGLKQRTWPPPQASLPGMATLWEALLPTSGPRVV